MIEPTNLEISKSIDKCIIGALQNEIEGFASSDNSSDLAKIIFEIVGMGMVCDIIEKCSEYMEEFE